MGRIHHLSSTLANQIAAGEVVERPASVVKELLENSLDAGATRLEIDLEAGGTRLVRVRDDGEGIDAADLPLAVARHATSKIGTLDDLEQVLSLGFRGEALASIASVSRLSLTSATEAAAHGNRLELDVNGEARLTPAAHPRGTTIEVRELFFNTPARRKFLRAERTEYGHCEEVVRRLALARFEAGFQLRHNQKPVFALRPCASPGEREQRVATLCGAPFLEQSLAIEFEASSLLLRGWVAQPAFSRSQADLQYFFVNGRVVRDRLVTHAVRQAYRDVMYHDRVSRDRPHAGRRERAPHQARGALPRRAPRARFPFPCAAPHSRRNPCRRGGAAADAVSPDARAARHGRASRLFAACDDIGPCRRFRAAGPRLGPGRARHRRHLRGLSRTVAPGQGHRFQRR
jgi:DNA mismatch repair protein MutL